MGKLRKASGFHNRRGVAVGYDERENRAVVFDETARKVMSILERRDRMDWDDDEEGDALYLSIGRPRKATGVDIGQGVVVRYDEKKREVVGLTILGVRARLIKSLGKA